MRPTAKRTDRRTVRTQTALREALIRLLRRKEYSAIRIQEILEEANIGRSTFYSHCAGKDQLLRLCMGLLRTELEAVIDSAVAQPSSPNRRYLPFSLPLLTHLAEHRDLYPSLGRGRGNELFLGQIRQVASELARADLTSRPKRPDIPQEILLQFVVGSFMALLTWWLEHKARPPPEILDEMFQKLVQHGLGLPRSMARAHRL